MEEQNENAQPPQENTQESPHETTQPTQPTQPIPTKTNENLWPILCHLAGLLGYTAIPFANVLGPLVIWLIKKDEIPALNAHGKAAINFQISMTIYFIACIPLVLIVIGIFLMALVGILNVIFIIIATVKAADGEVYDYPLSIKFLK